MKLSAKILLLASSLGLSVNVFSNENIDGVKDDVSMISNYDTYKMDRVADTISRITRVGVDFERNSRTAITVKYTTFRMELMDEKLLYLLKDTHLELNGLHVVFYGNDKSKIKKLKVYEYLQDLGLNVSFKEGVYKCQGVDLEKISDCRINSIQIYAARS